MCVWGGEQPTVWTATGAHSPGDGLGMEPTTQVFLVGKEDHEKAEARPDCGEPGPASGPGSARGEETKSAQTREGETPEEKPSDSKNRHTKQEGCRLQDKPGADEGGHALAPAEGEKGRPHMPGDDGKAGSPGHPSSCAAKPAGQKHCKGALQPIKQQDHDETCATEHAPHVGGTRSSTALLTHIVARAPTHDPIAGHQAAQQIAQAEERPGKKGCKREGHLSKGPVKGRVSWGLQGSEPHEHEL